MKRKIAYFCFATCLLTAGIFASLGNPASAKAEEQDSTQKEASSETGDSAQLKTLLEGSGFTVQQGSFYELDTVKSASEGKLMSCFGNNAGSSYMVFNLPEAPDQEVPNPTFPPDNWQYKLCQDEALVLVTPFHQKVFIIPLSITSCLLNRKKEKIIRMNQDFSVSEMKPQVFIIQSSVL